MDERRDIDLDQFHALLTKKREELISLSQSSARARDPVALDQQSTGRVTRQDALQQQAMAKAQEVRRIREISKIDDALGRIADGEFGACAECGEDIATKRLEIDPTNLLCITCAAGDS